MSLFTLFILNIFLLKNKTWKSKDEFPKFTNLASDQTLYRLALPAACGPLNIPNSKNEIVLEWKAREPKPIGKGKVTVQKTATIPYQNIDKAQIKLVF